MSGEKMTTEELTAASARQVADLDGIETRSAKAHTERAGETTRRLVATACATETVRARSERDAAVRELDTLRAAVAEALGHLDNARVDLRSFASVTRVVTLRSTISSAIAALSALSPAPAEPDTSWDPYVGFVTAPAEPTPEETACPDGCPLCTGEACDMCGAGIRFDPDRPRCEHDVIERHVRRGSS